MPDRYGEPAEPDAPEQDTTDYAAARYTDPNDPRVTEALSRRCDQCGAPPGQPCHNHITKTGGPLPGRIVHHGRTENP